MISLKDIFDQDTQPCEKRSPVMRDSAESLRHALDRTALMLI